ncbi:KamA family radical SAM protein [Thermodesulforhabdus norvegica]|uniref:L-lysine 2,3-aminomutase n=1 Tax=Thermodesulforhabdus norvegica TaxID=39841 RepID=A0A1I4SW19_9BACT|nr:KamA family radical SAM protein [Thermodesulforhabdus norvegica]SFM68696.1 L-lysine 2,3-aminomutase [Thermodesulforhabdus norvegica]
MSYTLGEIKKLIMADPDMGEVLKQYPLRITPHIARQIKRVGDPIWRQFVPDVREIKRDGGFRDPLGEEELSPVSGLVHRYPDRVLWLVTERCAAFCRFCTRKRLWATGIRNHNREDFNLALGYIEGNPKIREVILSGGDPLTLKPGVLLEILRAIRRIPHVEIIRVHTRLPVVSPKSITQATVLALKEAQPLYLNIHVNHPQELTTEVRRVLTAIADAGIPLGSQTVLLRKVNDNPETLESLFRALLTLRVRPYYLLQPDLMEGTSHFRPPLSLGIKIMKHLRHRLSGMAMPHFMVDLPGGGGKIELVPSFIRDIDDDFVYFETRTGGLARYPLEHSESRELLTLFREHL